MRETPKPYGDVASVSSPGFRRRDNALESAICDFPLVDRTSEFGVVLRCFSKAAALADAGNSPFMLRSLTR